MNAPGSFLVAVLATFGATWLFVPFAGVLSRQKLLAPSVAFFCLVLVAQVVLSSRIVRVLAMAYPFFLLAPLTLFAQVRSEKPG